MKHAAALLVIIAVALSPAAALETETFYVPFDGARQWADIAAGNPFPLGSGWEVSDGALRITSTDGYLAWDATENVPHQRGTLSLRIDAADDFWRDGKRHCLFALSRSVTGIFAQPERWETTGLALSLHKTERNTLDLVAHTGGSVFLSFAELEPLISVDVSGLRGGESVVAVAWDWAERTVTLAAGDVQEAAIPAQLTEPWPYHMLVIGNTGVSSPFEQEPLGAAVDSISVTDGAFEEWAASQENGIRFATEPPEPPVLCAEPTIFTDDELLAQFECICRRHLEALIRAQEIAGSGGWNLAVAWPSLMTVMGQKSRLPETDGYFLGSKDGNTAFGGLFLAWGYEALGDERYLQAAERTGQMYLRLQSDGGWWQHSYVYENDEYVPTRDMILLQDHAQTGPMMLMMYLHRLTGKAEYLEAGMRSADFLASAQNDNGSWSYIYDAEQGIGLTAQRTPGGGEVNDYGTSGPIEALLHMARLTGKAEYREAALRGADWLVDVMIDNGKVVGWAAQYDAQNQPIPARHFEPASVSIYGSRWAAPGLAAAYWETRDERYLDPLNRVIAWLEANEAQPGQWWWDYEVETGRPIQMWERKIYYLDDPAQVEEFARVSGRTPQTSTVGRPDLLRGTVTSAVSQPWGKITEPPTREGLARYVESQASGLAEWFLANPSQGFDEEAGMFLSRAQSGRAMTLHPHQCVRLLELLMKARAARGDVPIDEPMLRRVEMSQMNWNAALPVPEGL